MQARITGQVADLVARHPGETIVCVSHADPIKAALAQALGTPLDLFQRLVVGPCSVSAVLHGPERPTVLTVNSTGRLVGLGPS
jgi:probable phosphoglycerate mutase